MGISSRLNVSAATIITTNVVRISTEQRQKIVDDLQKQHTIQQYQLQPPPPPTSQQQQQHFMQLIPQRPNQTAIEKWEYRAAGLLANILTEIDQEDYIAAIGFALSKQIEYYQTYDPSSVQNDSSSSSASKQILPPPSQSSSFGQQGLFQTAARVPPHPQSQGVRIIIRLLGVCVQNCQTRTIALQLMDRMIESTNYGIQTQRQALA
ncbi:MAG: hypothetical protein EZS28_054749, partial [Streblomastix strix]